MRIDTRTKYRCNGCGAEETNPLGWMSFSVLSPMTFVMTTGATHSEDFCRNCVTKMKVALSQETTK